MSKPSYQWKRFWCPRTGSMTWDEAGYLYDPDTDWGKAHNPDLVTLEAIADVPCLVLLGEPGIGKSHEMENLKAITEGEICDPRQIFKLDLRSCNNLKEDLFKDEIFTDWLADSYPLYLFLDSFDEGLLSIRNLATVLIDELNKPQYRNHINRLHLRLACRTFVFPEILEKGLEDLWKEGDLAIYELAPLRRVDVTEAAKAEGFSSNDFLNEVQQKNVVPLAIKPITLKFLLNIYHRQNGRFLPEQKRHELYHEGCKLLCEEMNESRQASDRTGNFDSDQRLIVAARIAAVTIFSNRFAVWTSVDQGNIPIEDVLIQKLYLGREEANERVFEVTKQSLQEALDTGLFSSRGLHRMGWAHQTYAEFLAAWYLIKHEIPLAQVKQLIFSSDPDRKLIPQLYETAAWLASMSLDILQEIIKTDPDVLLQTDVPTDTVVRTAIVDNLLRQYEEGTLFDRGKTNYRNYAKLDHPELANQLRPYICDSDKKFDVRNLAIDILEVCNVSVLQDELLSIALNSSEPNYLRASAVRVIGSIGDSETKLKLRSLAVRQIPEDEADRLKGYVLKALWPEHLSAEELFSSLTRPKRINLTGIYRIFLNYELVPKLQQNDLAIALNWLQDQGVRCFGNPFHKTGDDLIFKAWQHLDIPGVLENFTKVILVQWKHHQNIITFDEQLHEEFAAVLFKFPGRRRKLLEQLVLTIERFKIPQQFLSHFWSDRMIVPDDFDWLLSKINTLACGNLFRIDNTLLELNLILEDLNLPILCILGRYQYLYAQLVPYCFDINKLSHVDAIISAAKQSAILCDVFALSLNPIDLDSEIAQTLKSRYLKEQELERKVKASKSPRLLESPPKERVLYCLEKLESGDLSAWWKLNLEMTLKPDSTHYDNELELDLTQLPGWQDADEATQGRIIEGAKQFIGQQGQIDYSWIGIDDFDRSSISGCRAFLLLFKEDPEFFQNLSSEIWKKWTSVIMAISIGSHYKESYLELVKYAYLNAPTEFINTLTTLIHTENQKHEYLFVIDRLANCWDKQLQFAVLKIAQDSSLCPKCLGQLLTILLNQGFPEARIWAESLVSLPLPSDVNQRETILVVSKVLAENSDSASWPFIWSQIQDYPDFGRKIVERMAEHCFYGIKLNLEENQLADLYCWLVRQYPYEEDPDHSNEIMDDPSVRDGIADLRNSILSQLESKGTPEACDAIRHLIQELPQLDWLKKTLVVAQANMRRNVWEPLNPEEFLQLVMTQEPSSSDLFKELSTIESRTKKMEDEPKIENNFNISNSPINAPLGNSGETHSSVTISSSDAKTGSDDKKRPNWGTVLVVMGIGIGMMVSGAYNEEFRQLINRIFSPQIEQQSTPENR